MGEIVGTYRGSEIVLEPRRGIRGRWNVSIPPDEVTVDDIILVKNVKEVRTYTDTEFLGGLPLFGKQVIIRFDMPTYLYVVRREKDGRIFFTDDPSSVPD